MHNPWIYRAPAIGWGFFILYVCLAPPETLRTGIDFEISDKVVHFTLYLLWVVLLYFGSSRGYKKVLSYAKLMLYWSSAIIIGILVEYLQMWMAVGRSAEVLDALANSAGAVAGIIISRVAHRILC